MTTNPIPEGYPRVSPYLVAKDADKAIDFCKDLFGAVEKMRLVDPNGKVCHAELEINDSLIMLADEFPEMGFAGPEKFGGSPISMNIYVEDCDKVFSRALELGSEEVRPHTTQFYGDRSGMIKDPFGHTWNISTHVEEVTPEEVEKRFKEFMNK